MKSNVRIMAVLLLAFLLAVFLALCDGGDNDVTENGGDNDSSDVVGIPQFVEAHYIEPESISQISKFRSGVGHNYSDDFESCRSMKHYFQPGEGIDWSTVKIFSPVNGTVSGIDQEWAGAKVQINSEEYPTIFFILFHVSLNNSLSVGDQVVAGQQIGTHIGLQTMSDIAVGMSTPDGWKLISYFDVITDSLFQDYQSRGLNSRNDVIITREVRDADPLTCDGEEFTDSSNLENWVILN